MELYEPDAESSSDDDRDIPEDANDSEKSRSILSTFAFLAPPESKRTAALPRTSPPTTLSFLDSSSCLIE